MADKEFTQICKEILGLSKKLEKIEPEELRKIKTDIERISEAITADKTLFDTNKKDFDGKYNKIVEIIKTFDTLKAQIEEVLKNGTINDSAEALISTFSSKKIMDLLNEAKRVIDEKFSTIFLKTTGNQTLDGILETTNVIRALTTKNSTDNASYAGASFEARGQGDLNPAVAFHSPNRFAFTLEAEGSSNLVILNQPRNAVGTLRANLNGTATNSQKLDGLDSTAFVQKNTEAALYTLNLTSNNRGDNLRIGDDVCLGDIGVDSTLSIKGQFSEGKGFIKFGKDGPRLGNDGDNTLTCNGARVVLGVDFACQKNPNGYTRLPNGLILQWGSIAIGLPGERAFPIAFPNIVLAVIAGNADAQGAGVDNAFAYAISKEKFYYGTKTNQGPVSAFPGSYIAIGY